jgi:hypothetical protein
MKDRSEHHFHCDSPLEYCRLARRNALLRVVGFGIRKILGHLFVDSDLHVEQATMLHLNRCIVAKYLSHDLLILLALGSVMDTKVDVAPVNMNNG